MADCFAMSVRSAFFRWFVVGVVLGTVFIVTEAMSSGGPAGLLRVGEESVVRPIVEAELGRDIPHTRGAGHDGQFFYAIGVDLTGDRVAELSGGWAYRYRRILYPLTASAFGLLDGYGLLYGMMVVSALSFGLAAAAVAAVSVTFGRSDWLALAVILNPGAWLSVSLLTSDLFAMALMALALLLLVSGRRRDSIAAFVLSVLGKETYLVTPAGLALTRDRKQWPLLWVPAAVLFAWMTTASLTIGEGFATRGNLGPPFIGILEAARGWPGHRGIDWFYLSTAILFVIIGLTYGALRRSWLRWPILGWSLVAVISAQAVWEYGNNAVRVFMPIPILVALAMAEPKDLHSISPASTKAN